jgi:heat shock transcription factor
MDYDTANLGNEQLFNWSDPNITNNMSTAFPDNSTFDPNLYPTFNGSAQQQSAQGGSSIQASNQLVRRNTNHQLAARNGQQVQDPWEQDFALTAGQGQQPGWETADDDEEELEQKALVAKKEAQAKRKQIPPFVQKLSR